MAMRNSTKTRNTEITPKQTLFVEAYANPNSETFNNATRSYIFAGYKSGSSVMQCACRLLSSAKVKQAIELYQPQQLVKRVEINREYAFNKHQELYDRCFKDHDYTNCVALLRMIWQQQGLLDNKLVIDLKDSRQLEEGHREAARRIAAHLLSDGILEAEFEPTSLLNDNESSDNDKPDNTVESSE